VAIRNIQFNENGVVSLGSGCGIVNSSELQSEWQELLLKRQTVREMLGI
jgi:isochorismate synthase EntC